MNDRKENTLKNQKKIVYIGKTLRRLRDEKGLSQGQLACNSKLNRTYVGELERDNSKASIDTIFQLAFGMGLEPYELIREIQKDNPGFISKMDELIEKE
jgi:transcriptional regulator with XRE-family HTH domain